MARYLIEIAVKYTGQHVEYREVDAAEEYDARHKAIDDFERDCRHSHKKIVDLFCAGIYWNQCCATDSVCLEEIHRD